MSRRRGFTLIELLVVISIISLLSSVVLASLNAAREKGRIGAARYFASQVDHVAGEQAVGVWDFDECSSTSAADRSGFGNNGALMNMAVPSVWSSDTPATMGCSLEFDGVDGHVNVPDNASLNFGTGDFTIALWAKNSQSLVTDDPPYTLVTKSDSNLNTTPGFGLLMRGGSYGGVFLRIGATDGHQDMVTSPSKASLLSDGRWHHIVVTRNAGIGTIYIDGSKAGTGTVNKTTTNTRPLQIGIYGSSVQPFGGFIDSVRVFSKSLVAQKVLDLYTSEAPRFNIAAK